MATVPESWSVLWEEIGFFQFLKMLDLFGPGARRYNIGLMKLS